MLFNYKKKSIGWNVWQRSVKHSNNYFYDYDVFVHCVSADFQISAEITVDLRKLFGRPSMSDCLDQNLVYQKIKGTPVVYSLITKEKFQNKPLAHSYDKAFQLLQNISKLKITEDQYVLQWDVMTKSH